MLYRLARTWIGGLVASWILSRFSFAIPVNRLFETPVLMAFHHPSPSYPVHVLIVPKKKYRSIQEFDPEDSAFMRDMVIAVQELIRELDLASSSYHLIANGGDAQEIPYLHFHLISGEEIKA
jgi:histidine triad (HIT) family protein